MNELIEKIVDAASAAIVGEDWEFHRNDFRESLYAIFPPATILPEQFKKGVPTEDGMYICICDCGEGITMYQIEWKDEGTRTTSLPILSYCKLPEINITTKAATA